MNLNLDNYMKSLPHQPDLESQEHDLALAANHILLQNYDEAEIVLLNRLKTHPTDPKCLYNLAITLLSREVSARDYAVALEYLKEAITYDERNPLYYLTFARTCFEIRKFFEAEFFLKEALNWRPDYLHALYALIDLYLATEKYDQAKNTLDHLLKTHPNIEITKLIEIKYYREIGQFDKAISLSNDLLFDKPYIVNGWIMLSALYCQIGNLPQAISTCIKSVRLLPQDPAVYLNLGLCLYNAKKFRLGHIYHAYRKTLHNIPAVPSYLKHTPAWQGEDPSNKRLFLYREQGLGDMIYTLPYINQLSAFYPDCQLIVQMPVSLINLFKNAITHPHLRYIEDIKEVDQTQFDFQAPLMDLFQYLPYPRPMIPSQNPYLFIRPEVQEKWKKKLGSYSDHKLKIGICTTGNPFQGTNNRRKIDLKTFMTKMKDLAPYIEWFNLTYDKDQVNESDLSEFNIHDLTKEPGDFEDTGGFLQQLDLIITTDTSLCHLAGGLGLKTWTLLCLNPYWIWSQHETHISCYPHMKLYRQTKYKQWDDVFDKIKSDLNKELKQKEYRQFVQV